MKTELKRNEKRGLSFSIVHYPLSILLLLAAVILAGCAKKKEPVTPSPTNVAVTGVSINGSATVSIAENASVTLEITIAPANATNKSVTWKSSDATVATVDNNGKVTGVKAGAATITVTTADGSKTATVTVTVTGGGGTTVAVTGVTLNKQTISIAAGVNETLTATVAPNNATNQNVTWKSSDETVATVDSNGKVIGVKAGSVTITVTTADGGKTATCAVTVTGGGDTTVAVTGVTLNKQTTSIAVGANETLLATVAPTNATNKAVTWKSSDATVASVDANGKVTAVKAGSATITVTTADGGKTATCTVTVNTAFVAVTGINGVPTGTTVGTLTLSGTVAPANATNRTIVWSLVSIGTTGATLNGSTLTTTAAGAVKVKATITNGTAAGTNYTEDFDITVTTSFVAVTSITGVPTTATAGTNLLFTPTVVPANATNQSIVWSLEGLYVAGTSISSSKIGGVTFRSPEGGDVTIKATIKEGKAAGVDYVQTFTINVAAVPVVITITTQPAPTTTVTAGSITGSLSVTASVTPSATLSYQWYSNNTNSNSGGTAITGATAASFTIPTTLTAGTYYYYCVVSAARVISTTSVATVTVNTAGGGGTAPSFYQQPKNITASVNGNWKYFEALASGTPSPTLQWQVSTNNGGTWNNISDGGNYNGGNYSGTTTQTLMISNITSAMNGYKYRCVATNSAAPTGVNSNAATLTVIVGVADIMDVPTIAYAGTSLTLSGRVIPNNATYQTITWSVVSAGTTGATVTGNTFNAASTGTATIKATITNGIAEGDYTKNFTVTVNPAFKPVTNITGLPSVTVAGAILTLTGTVVPADATNRTITWSVNGSPIIGNNYIFNTVGTATVRATIVNGASPTSDYIKDFTITVNAFVPVTDITGLPNTAIAGTPLTLTGTVVPSNATNQTITWSINAGAATITGGNIFTATQAGTVTVAATIHLGTSPSSGGYSKLFNITVNGPPVFVQQPQDNNFKIGNNIAAYFRVATNTGSGATYQWQVSTNNGGSWSNISDGTLYSGTKNTQLNITYAQTTTAMNGYKYRCQATNGYGSTTSSVATLTVTP